MSNLKIQFSQSPLWLLLLIPAIVLPLIIYFCSAKKYRRTRNRIISLVLHSLIMLLAVFLLAGMSFAYQVPNTDNEIILLVDASNSTETTQERKDEFVLSAIEGKSPAMKMGIITFGCNQVYAAPLTYEADGLYNAYVGAELPDDSATDFESALLYASRQFENPGSAKIVLISDGEETDGNVRSVIKSVSAQGIKVDTLFISEEKENEEVRIAEVQLPEEAPTLGKAFSLQLVLESNYVGSVEFTMTDNGEADESQGFTLSGGRQTIEIQHTFVDRGLHELGFRIEAEDSKDSLSQNNSYYSYYYLEEYDNVLVIERTNGESSEFVSILQKEYQTEVVGISDTEKMPSSVNELRQYDEVILFNIANADMPVGFDEIINSYVYDYGGNVLTVGGKRDGDVANVYNRDDMRGTLYQEMLPVEAIEYTPPIAVVFIIDRSGSMQGDKLELAKDGALQSLQALTSRDWVGVMTLENEYNDELALTPVPQLSDIEAAIDAIQPGGGTNYTNAIQHAGAALSILDKVQKRHIIIISDGQPGDELWGNAVDQTGGYGGAIKSNYEQHGITCSIVSVATGGNVQDMETAVNVGGGKFYQETDMTKLAQTLTEDLREKSIEESNEEEFIPKIRDLTTVVNGINQAEMPALGGYYGTRLKDGAVQPLVTPYGDVPIYAQWNYGKGKVGSFMSDLSGDWADVFLESLTGQQILLNMIEALYPNGNIHPQDISMSFEEQNYTTEVNIFGVGEGETAELKITALQLDESFVGDGTVEIIQPTDSDYYSRASFVIRQPGIYMVTIEKKDASGNVIASAVAYKAFSYSAEYNYFSDTKECESFLGTVANDGDGMVINLPGEIFDSLVRTLGREFDPRVLFSILIIVMFLLDVAVRKFKFKWPHEIVRDHREKKRMAQRENAGRV